MTSRRIIVLFGMAIILIASAAYIFVDTEEPVKEMNEMELVTVESILSKSESGSKLSEGKEEGMQSAPIDSSVAEFQDGYEGEGETNPEENYETDMPDNQEKPEESIIEDPLNSYPTEIEPSAEVTTSSAGIGD